MAILATSSHAIHMEVIRQLSGTPSRFKLAAISSYDDEMEELKKEGVDVVFNLYAEAGAGYAADVARVLNI